MPDKEDIYGLDKKRRDFLNDVQVLKSICDFAHGKAMLDERTDWTGEARQAFQRCLDFLEVDLETLARLANVEPDRLTALFDPDHGVDAVQAAYDGTIAYSIQQYPRTDWRVVSDAEESVDRLLISLRRLIEAVSRSNAIMGAGEGADVAAPLTPLQRDMLLLIAKTIVAELESPAHVVDRGRIAQFGYWLRQVVRRGAEKGFESEIHSRIETAADAAGDLAKRLSEGSGFDILPF